MTSISDRPATILLVEDRPEVLEVVRRTLATNGYTVETAADGEAGLHKALDLKPDLVILDVGLPRLNGMELTRELRRRAFHAPVLMLTALDTISDKVMGLDAGADDYLPKPFDYQELLARVNALLRRATLRADDTTMRVGDLALNPMSRQVTRDQISDGVWKQSFDPASNIVDVYISYLRQKIDDPAGGGPPLLHTVRGTGYQLSAEPPK